MEASVPIITLTGLAIGFLPAGLVVFILYRWSSGSDTATYALFRMGVQLALIGYALHYIFDSGRAWITIMVLVIMLLIAGWIALRPLQKKQPHLYTKALLSITIGGVTTLLLVAAFVIDIEPWYEARVVIPLAGMIFASSMNTVSVAAERFYSERDRGADYLSARRTALQAGLIPITNSLFAVGLVSLPGMMTGQILAGISPLIAARYQIVVMCMLFGSSGIAAACYLLLERHPNGRAENT
jgi:putative ABC transport system permease protein